MALRLAKTVILFLQQRPNQRFTRREIADWIVATYPDECAEKIKNSSAKKHPVNDKKSVVSQIASEFSGYRSQFENAGIKITEGRPQWYYFPNSSDSEAIDAAEAHPVQSPDTVTQWPDATVQPPLGTVQPPHTPTPSPQASAQKRDFTEHDLYPILSKFLWLELEVYSKRINEGRSSNSRGPRGNKWLHPDVVGFENLSQKWHREIKQFAEQQQSRRTRLWSFEVKKSISHSNLREAFFQTVSNSSWANFGYLVACEFRGTNIKEEMRILASLHGIGFIKLNFETPAESEIMIPARERSEVDWDTANRLTEENTDFKKYIQNIRHFYQTNDIRGADWDYEPSSN